MRLFSALLALLNLACTPAQAGAHEEIHPWNIVAGVQPAAVLGVSKIEWVEVDRGFLYSDFKTYVFQSEAEIVEGIHLLRRIMKNREGDSPHLGAYSEAGYVVFHGQDQEITLLVRYAEQEKWWRFLYYPEGDFISASVQSGRDEEWLIRAWFQNPDKLAYTRKYPSRWLSWVMALVILVWLLRIFIGFSTRQIRRLAKRGL